MIPTQKLLNIPVTCLPFEEQTMLILRWAKMRASKVICLANVHMLMEAYWNPSFEKVLSQADLVTPDGKPLVLMLRKLGILNQNQVAGMDVFLNLCDLAEQTGIGVYFLGSSNEILAKIANKLNREYPVLKISGMNAIPSMSIEDVIKSPNYDLVEEINQSGAGIVFVCLGCPKQEIWMSQHQGLIDGVMIGVGAVFSMYAGINPRAPFWIQRIGLEWLYRLSQEPRRLWRRYGSTIPPFLYLAIKQLVMPYKKKLGRIRQQLLEENIEIDFATLDFSAEHLGEILVKQGIVSREDLEKALFEQSLHPKVKIGEIFVRKGSLSRSQLKFYLRNQNIKFGELLIEKKILKQRSLNNILSIKSKTNQKIGEIILEQEIITKNKLEELLVEQYVRRKGLLLTKSISSIEELSSWISELRLNNIDTCVEQNLGSIAK